MSSLCVVSWSYRQLHPKIVTYCFKMSSVTQLYLYRNIYYKLKRSSKKTNVVNNVDMSSFKAPWQNDPYTETHTEQYKTRRTPRRNIHSEKNYFWCVFSDFYSIFIYNSLNDFSKKCWVTAFVRSMTHSGFKPVFSLRKPNHFSTFFGEEKEINVHLLSPTRPLRRWTER